MGPCGKKAGVQRFMPYLSKQKDGTNLLNVYVQPRASRNGLVGMHDGCLKLAISSPPVDDKANKAVVSFLADFFQIPFREIRLCSGKKSRRKQLAIGTVSEYEIRRRVGEGLADGQE